TIASHLKAAGYRTYFTGKWHLGKTPETLPRAHGYDRAFALSQSGADNFENKPNLLLYDAADWTEDGKPAKLGGYSSTFLVDKTIAYIDSGSGSSRPFLASVNFLANHIPVQAPAADIARYQRRYTAGWGVLREERRQRTIAQGLVPPGIAMVTMDTTDDWASLTPAQQAQRAGAMAAYAGMATAMDREIGRLVTHLKTSGQYENTIFVFLSDNGPEATDPLNLGPRFNRWIAD
ncbi:sulfatase-like hydrolase/transferase, partial [Polymorphobacter multimanifer]